MAWSSPEARNGPAARAARGAPRASRIPCAADRRAGRAAEGIARLREAFLPLEDIRDARSPLCVLHRAVDLAGIADTGPLTPMLSDVVAGESKAELADVAQTLLAINAQLQAVA